MGNIRLSEWRKLPVSLAELCLATTLRCGQCFRWKQLVNNEWSCAIYGRIFVLKQDATHLYFRTIEAESVHTPCPAPSTRDSKSRESAEDDDAEELLRHYLNLTPNLPLLYKYWSSVDSNFKKRAPQFTGVRILKQDPWEALVGFICSSNNNILRISQMVNKLCVHYGTLIGHVDGEAFHEFPTPEALARPGIEHHLKELGFGYRAGYIARTAATVASEKPANWLRNLCCVGDTEHDSCGQVLPSEGREGYRKAHEELLELKGVGPKVADCVCLMGLGWGEAVPVDTHVWQIAQRDYRFGKGKHRSLTKATYDAVGNYFRQLWGKEAGWAHSVLFAADLKAFSARLETKIDLDMGIDIELDVVVKGEIPVEVVKTEIVDKVSRPLDSVSSRTLRAKRRKITR